MANPELKALKRSLLAVTVYHDIDFTPADEGIVLAGDRLVTWDQALSVLRTAGIEPNHGVAPDLLARFLTFVTVIDGMPDLLLADSARVVGLPVGHLLNPGLSWVVERLHGDSLDLGLGFVGLDVNAPEKVVIVPPAVWAVLDADPLRWWNGARKRLEELGAVAAQRLSREPDALRPIGDADAVTLLGARSLRTALASRDGGMAAIAVPMLRRGWTRLSLLDPAFAPAAAVATAPVDRGFERPVLVTADEVKLAGNGDWARLAVLDGRLPSADVSPLQRA